MDCAEALAREGFAAGPRIDGASLLDLERRIPALKEAVRQPVPLAPLEAWLEATPLAALMRGLMGPEARPVRALAMAKEGGHNWEIRWHRDTTVLVLEMREVAGFQGWTNKAHFYQAQAPREVMAAMLSLRLHLDDCGDAQGPLQVVAGSHLHEGMDPDGALTVTAARGDVLLMRPLLLHASAPASDPSPRRVLHIEWASEELPGGLQRAWF